MKNEKFKYSVAQIAISLKCIVNSSVGFRTLSKIFIILKEKVNSLGIPVYTTIRMWLCKFGLYKLNTFKCGFSRYFHIIDTSVQMGKQKFVVVLGVKQQDTIKNFSPNLKQVEVLALRPLESCKGDVISDILNEAAEKTGAPLGIISDEAVELKGGARLFAESVNTEERPIHLFDCSHKLNNFLKNELKNDAPWNELKKASGEAVQHLKLSPIAHLSPPRRRIKERMHDSFSFIEWGLELINYLNSEEAQKNSNEQLNKLLWIKQYESSLITYKYLMEINKKALDLVHTKGYYRWIEHDFIKSMEDCYYTDERCLKFYQKVGAFLGEQGRKVPDGQHYLGSSEIIESLFGKFKYMEDHHSASGLTSLVLAVPALAGEVNELEIYNAMNAISTKDVNEWVENNMGQTFLSKRREDLQSHKPCSDTGTHEVGKSIDLDYCEKIRSNAA